MLKNLINILEKPPLYTKMEVPFWDDEYISKQMLNAHLDPNFEGASRKIDFIDQSVEWIKNIMPYENYNQLLDIGCGPGIYAEKFARIGYSVTGVDFSKRSINYAIDSAQNKSLDICYLYQNYLNMDLCKKFDLATMIYCDYGALSTTDRQIVMKTIHHHLKPGGKFLLDVFSTNKFNAFQEKQSWEICYNGGFWSKEKYVALNGCFKYSDNVTLEKTCIISSSKTVTYHLWTTYFTNETLVREAADAGFKICEIFGDVTGSAYHDDNHTIAILLEK